MNNNPYFYLATDIDPCYKYYHTQDLHSSYDSKTKEEWYKLVKSGEADYLVINKLGKYPVYKLIEDKYKVTYQNNRFAILEKK